MAEGENEVKTGGRDERHKGHAAGDGGWSVLLQCLGFSHLAPASSPHKASDPISKAPQRLKQIQAEARWLEHLNS